MWCLVLFSFLLVTSVSGANKADFIIVGGGLSGLVIANRLSVDYKVLVLEAGGPSLRDTGGDDYVINAGHFDEHGRFIRETPWTRYDVPSYFISAYSPVIGTTWNITGANVGKLIGGSSAHNAMVWVRGIKTDFDGWDLDGWDWDNMLYYYKKSETFNLTAGDTVNHGYSGPMNIRGPPYNFPEDESFLQSCSNAGYTRVLDYNLPFKDGVCAPLQFNIKNGRRFSAVNGYYLPIKDRCNLKVRLHSTVTKILIDGANRAYGVTYKDRNGRTRTVTANKEVILTAGTLNTPKLLLLSGIGAASELQKFNIPIVSNLPGVGQNVRNHPLLPLFIENKNRLGLLAVDSALPELNWASTGEGPFSSPGFSVTAFVKSDPSEPHHDVSIIFGPSDAFQALPNLKVMTFILTMSRPSHTGNITIISNNPDDGPVLHFQSIDTITEQKLAKAIRITRNIISLPPFSNFVGEQILPSADLTTDAQLEEYARNFGIRHDHWFGSCKMGKTSDPLAVVDTELRVFGVDNLRIADASIIPSAISDYVQATQTAIAEKAADIILGSYS
eukprot:TRINITY_DN3111_c0_g1_i1.p1 TRINITY_DN3111_c0_g1~~TRINITY_DN3111_c0_g1_i1.p1  ORF type:complete len:557 (-),score=101.04 TRINITY_DN3111_c0_g1_i1:41-1711(-)